MCKLSFGSVLAIAVVVAVGGRVQARHVVHPVTPDNIDKQPYAFEVKVKDGDKGQKSEFVEFEIRVLVQAGKQKPGECAHGKIGITHIGEDKIRTPPLTMVTSVEETRFTFRMRGNTSSEWISPSRSHARRRNTRSQRPAITGCLNWENSRRGNNCYTTGSLVFQNPACSKAGNRSLGPCIRPLRRNARRSESDQWLVLWASDR